MSSGATDQSLLPLFVMRRRGITAIAPATAMSASDEELLKRLEAGDWAAIEPLFERYATLIFGIGLRRLHDRGEAEDLVQDVFLHLCEKAKGFNPALGSARTWLVHIAYRRAFDRFEYLGNRRFYNGTDVESEANALSNSLDAQLAEYLTAERVRAAFDELNEKQRATLEMHFFEGLKLREISARLGESLENTRHHYYRGLNRLRRIALKQGRTDEK